MTTKRKRLRENKQ